MKQKKDILQVVTCLNGAVSNTRLYAADHPQVVRYLQRAHGQLRQVLKAQTDITFLIVDDDVVVGNQAVTSKMPHLAQFVQMLKQCAIERLTFTSDVTFEELAQLVGDLAATDKEVVHSSPGIKLGKVRVQIKPDPDQHGTALTPETKERLEALARFREYSLDSLKDLYHQI